MTRCEQLTQDYLHKLELEGPGYHECARIARDISQCRLDRRNAKASMRLDAVCPVEIGTTTLDFPGRNWTVFPSL